MNINGNEINVFTAQYAYQLASGDESGNHSALFHLISNSGDSGRKYLTGDRMDERYSPFCLFPENFAVLIPKNDHCELQTFSGDKVGVLFSDLEKEKDAVCEYFSKSGNELLILENGYAAILPSDYDNLFGLIKQNKKIAEQATKMSESVNQLQKRLDRNIHNCRKLLPSDVMRTFEKCNGVTQKSIDFMFGCIKQMLAEGEQELDKYYSNPTGEIQNMIMFGLYYHAIHKVKSKISGLSCPGYFESYYYELVEEYIDLVTENPDIEQKYCEHLNLPKYKRDNIHALLSEEGISKRKWGMTANEILDTPHGEN